ncbi:MAG TPA: PIG-L family deacetylase [Thermoanaerobaculia bacterium]|nr:PIG-L family deacetylase [Thermoanaerobaculia bacterium]
MRSLVALALLLSTFPAAARVRAVGSRLDQPRTIVVVTAHPDDELLLAPYLANRCVRGGAVCTLLVMTTGNAAGLGDVRAGEMARAAAILNTRLIQWNYADVMTDIAATWAAQAGDRATLVRQLGDAIRGADMVLTFDPLHGSTGHPAHREIGSLVLETGVPHIWLVETVATFAGNGFVLANGGGDRSSVYVTNADWEFAVRVAETHATQFNAEQVESLRTLPVEQRRVWLMPH